MKTEQTIDNANAADQGAHVAPVKPAAKKCSSKKPTASKAKKVSKGKKSPARAKSAPKAGDRTKKAEVIAMMNRAKGVTLAEIMETTGWQAHTVRGFVSILGSKGGEKIESVKNADGERAYRIAR